MFDKSFLLVKLITFSLNAITVYYWLTKSKFYSYSVTGNYLFTGHREGQIECGSVYSVFYPINGEKLKPIIQVDYRVNDDNGLKHVRYEPY